MSQNPYLGGFGPAPNVLGGLPRPGGVPGASAGANGPRFYAYMVQHMPNFDQNDYLVAFEAQGAPASGGILIDGGLSTPLGIFRRSDTTEKMALAAMEPGAYSFTPSGMSFGPAQLASRSNGYHILPYGIAGDMLSMVIGPDLTKAWGARSTISPVQNARHGVAVAPNDILYFAAHNHLFAYNLRTMLTVFNKAYSSSGYYSDLVAVAPGGRVFTFGLSSSALMLQEVSPFSGVPSKTIGSTALQSFTSPHPKLMLATDTDILVLCAATSGSWRSVLLHANTDLTQFAAYSAAEYSSYGARTDACIYKDEILILRGIMSTANSYYYHDLLRLKGGVLTKIASIGVPGLQATRLVAIDADESAGTLHIALGPYRLVIPADGSLSTRVIPLPGTPSNLGIDYKSEASVLSQATNINPLSLPGDVATAYSLSVFTQTNSLAAPKLEIVP